MPAPRYAIYFVPAADTDLYRFGAAVLGYDCYSGEARAFLEDAEREWSNFTREPRVYGFHATLKPPFRLAEGYDEADLARAVTDFAANHAAVLIGEAIFGDRTIAWWVFAAIVGVVIYSLLQAVAFRVGLNAIDLRLVTAVLLLSALAIPRLRTRILR
ncbi:MAG: DUF1045 domain-containing protein [Pseudolabrys sp.]|nr:DUF1045 domain-containing protein [Pseudolabrys sp.]